MKYAIALGTLLTLTGGPVLADTSAESGNPTGAYVGAGWGRFNLHLRNLDDAGTSVDRITDSNDNAWKVFAGYRLNPYWSVEAAYINFGRPGDNFQAPGTDGSYQVKMHGFAPSIIGTLPLGPVELSGKVGYYFYDSETRINFTSGTFLQAKHQRSDFLYGAGLGVTVFSHLNAKVEYERVHARNAANSDAIWLTGAWRF